LILNYLCDHKIADISMLAILEALRSLRRIIWDWLWRMGKEWTKCE